MNSIILFGGDPDRGMLTYIEELGAGGETPRHFGIQPSAKRMVVATRIRTRCSPYVLIPEIGD